MIEVEGKLTGGRRGSCVVPQHPVCPNRRKTTEQQYYESGF